MMTAVPERLMPVYTKQESAVIAEIKRVLSFRKGEFYKPYSKQREFHDIGGDADGRERLLCAGNQTGKTYAAANETSFHLTGKYPDWWCGLRYDRPVAWMAASETSKLCRDGVQVHLCGWPKYPKGTGTIPGKDLLDTPSSAGIADAYDYIRVQHYNPQGEKDGESLCYLRSYDQGRERVQAMTLDGVWLDEEPDIDYYTECLTRTNVAMGPVYLTFTPLKGMSDVVRRFLIDKVPNTRIITMTLDDAEHFTPEQRLLIAASYPEHEREARTKGIPILGSGRIFPIAESRIHEGSMEIPAHWPRIIGLDFGYDHPTAAVWMAWDRDTDTVHIYDCYRLKEATPVVHAAAIKARGGDWIPVAWPHDGLQHDKGGSCEQLKEQYRKLGLNMLPDHATHPPEPGEKEGTGGNGLEAGLMLMLDRMLIRTLRVAKHLEDFWEEFRLYHRKDGKVVKVLDDALSAARYGLMMLRHAKVKPTGQRRTVREPDTFGSMGPFGV